VSWGVKFGGRPVTLDSNTGFLSNDGGTLALFDEGTYTFTATVRDDADNLTSAFARVTVTNSAPVIDSFTAEATREVRDGRYYADVTDSCSDPDGETVHLEWDGKYQPDRYYAMGAHTIRVRAVDEWGAASAWESRTIEFINSAQVITSFIAVPSQIPSGSRLPVDISVNAYNSDGDTWELEWGGDYQESGLYPVGTWTVQVRTVDQYDTASPWQSKAFTIEKHLSIDIHAPTPAEAGEAIPVTLTKTGNYPVNWSVTGPDGYCQGHRHLQRPCRVHLRHLRELGIDKVSVLTKLTILCTLLQKGSPN